MINMTNTQFVIYEVDVTWWDENSGEYCDCESEYVVVNSDNNYTYDDIIKSVNQPLQNARVYIYQARTGDFQTIMNKDGSLEFDATGDIDTSTGYNGSPVHEVYYDKDGNTCDPYENE